jgi:hypothetical protein
MNEEDFEMIEPGVLKYKKNEKGPSETIYQGTKYFRFMDYFYTHTEHLDELKPVEVSNLCRARAQFPELISRANGEVRSLFESLAIKIAPSSLLEIGAGKNPVFTVNTAPGMHYVLSDADEVVVKSHSNNDLDCYIFSDTVCTLPYEEGYFEMVIAVFVLHFPFYKVQLTELSRTLKTTGVIVANVYRRSTAAREKLASDIQDCGFKTLRIHDPSGLCLNHEYWIIGKSDAQMESCANTLKQLLGLT